MSNPALIRKGSRWKQGYIDPRACKKLIEKNSGLPIPYRSSYERRFIEYCESSPDIAAWGYECIPIKYRSALDNKEHTYWPDFYLRKTDGSRYIIEIKPYAQTRQPNQDTSRYAHREYYRNVSKWNAANQFANERGMSFIILTEHTLFPKHND